MKRFRKIWKIILFDSYGNIALASFVICLVSGIFIAVPYDVKSPYDSIALMMITNLPAAVFRNLHYWSAQFFLVFTLLHTWEHIKLKSSQELSTGPWSRLVVSLLVVFFVMLSGFILKGDADSMQAFRILESLFSKIPIAGELAARVILGEENNFQLLYVHHIATASLFLLYIIPEHAKTLWASRATLLIVLAFTSILSFFVHAPLIHNPVAVLKGPWYFIGLQEIMHWMGRPGWILGLILFLPGLVFLSRYAGPKTHNLIYKFLMGMTLVYLFLTVTGYFFRGENWKWKNPWDESGLIKPAIHEIGLRFPDSKFDSLTVSDIPMVRNRREACMNCHTNLSGFSPAHDPRAIGCTSCHLGNPFTLEKGKAHKNMIHIPGHLDNARITCGSADCHPAIAERIQTSLMTTNSGIVSVDRFVFLESASPDALSHIRDLGHGAADKHMRNLCSNCHLGNEKTETGPVNQLSRGGGCNACHLNYSPAAREQHEQYLAKGKPEEWLPKVHPSLDIGISNNHCFGCHSRSGRISTNYEGWHETLLEAEAMADHTGYRILEDERVFEFISADVHHTSGMDCIDCHNSYETMGDGTLYMHEEEAVKIQCEDCHSEQVRKTITYEELDAETKKVFDLRKFDRQRRMLKTGKGDIALVNAYQAGDSSFMVLKNSGKVLPLGPPASVCTNAYGHRDLTCSACHTSWAPLCIGCHNSFDRKANGYDMIENRFVKGEWVEYVGAFISGEPALGVRSGAVREIWPAIPGMILTIDRAGFDKNLNGSAEAGIFHRLYAPAAPHTTSRKGRSCKSCHNSSMALGYGQGTLNYQTEGNSGFWSFIAAYANNLEDGLPEDAWIGFLTEPGDHFQSTRSNFRPFTLADQQKILTVGACLTCHEEQSGVMVESLHEEFSVYLKKRTAKCILPSW